jgi:hypothetical protein
LPGLDKSAKQILKNRGLTDEGSWLKLIDLYEGNPQHLLSISSLIEDVFNGKVSDFLKEKSLVLTEEIEFGLTEMYDRLSPIEKQIILQLSRHEIAMSREDLGQNSSLPSMDLINSLQSLKRRYLIKTIPESNLGFNLSPVLREYVKNCIVVSLLDQ